ncbi:MAG: hypothetical protein QCI00_03935 [Candidatus Thermoplasmatota archaeon]|nr:hypothetical protein [Candidatus Thermoplasmatota archaeon]
MNQLTKAQITVSILACFSLGLGLAQHALLSDSLTDALGIIALQLAAIVIITFVLMSILQWIDVFDLKTNAIITLVTVVTFGLILMS